MQSNIDRNPSAPVDKVAAATVRQMTQEYTKRKNKDRMPADITTIDSSEYYREKRVNVNNIRLNPLIIPREHAQHDVETCEVVAGYCRRYLDDGPKIETRHGVMRAQEYMKTRRTTLAGSNVYCNGHETKEFEWSSKSINNRAYAFFNRQIGSLQMYDDNCKDEYLDFITPFMRERATRFNELYDHEQDLLEYPDR